MQKNQKETVREEWFNFFSKKSEFDAWLSIHTKDRNFVAYHAAAISLPIELRLFKGQGDPSAKPLKLGSKEFWKMYSKDSATSNKSSAATVGLDSQVPPLTNPYPEFTSDGSIVPGSQYVPRYSKFFDF